jgi:acetylornithine deacetylase/succinyl-diaminopimelate desuccinylase-like protein
MPNIEIKMRSWLWRVTGLILVFTLQARAQDPLASRMAALDWNAYQDETVRMMQEYLRIDTSNPPGNELAAAQFFHRLFDKAGIPNTIYEFASGRADFYAILKGDGSLRPFVMLNHMDVVRADPSHWRQPPFSGTIVDGEMYGRGAMDMKDEGLLQAMVIIIAARAHLPLKRDLIFLATGDEEVNDLGSTWFLENHADLVRNAEYLITEGGANLIRPAQGTIYGIGLAEKAPLWIRVTATGRGGHGSIPIQDSAPNRLIRDLRRVVDWQPPIRLLPFVEQYFKVMAQIEREPLASQFRDIRNSLKDPTFAREMSEDEDFNHLLRDTVSLTVLHSSVQTNVIPDTAYAELDVRLLPGEAPQAFLAELRHVLADEDLRVENINRFKPPNASSANTPLYRIIEAVVRKYNPRALVAPTLNSGYTESQMFRGLGITCYGFNTLEVTEEIDSTQHAANERVPVDQLRSGVKVLYEVVARAASE